MNMSVKNNKLHLLYQTIAKHGILQMQLDCST